MPENIEDNRLLDSWADHYDCASKLTCGSAYQGFTDATIKVIRDFVVPPARFVDFGAGTGRVSIPMAKQGYQVAAVEISAEMSRVLREKAQAGVEGAVANPCSVCRPPASPEAHQAGANISIFNQSMCEFLPEDGFGFGLCVFNVLNYLIEEKELQQFAAVSARAIRDGGKLLVGFVEDIRPLQRNFAAVGTRIASSPDGRCSIKRKIVVTQMQGVVYDYHDEAQLTKAGQPFSYEVKFPIREWSRNDMIRVLEVAGFKYETDLTDRFAMYGANEVYLLFSRNE